MAWSTSRMLFRASAPAAMIDVFTEDGTFVKTLIQGKRTQPGLGNRRGSRNFGPLSNTLLISNNSVDGTINAFDPITGKYVGTMKDQSGKTIILNNLWGIAFGGGNTTNGAQTSYSSPWVQGIGPTNWPAPLQESSTNLD